METLQKIFTQSYVDQLRDAITYPEERAKYLLDTFPIDEDEAKKFKVLAGIVHPEGLEEKMLASENEFEAAKLLYEAYPNLNPLIASSDRFWSYLCHVDLFRYCKKRWPIAEDVKEDFIKDHYFVNTQSRIVRNAVAALWWWVHFSIEKDLDNPYKYTEVLFKNYSFRATWFVVFLRIKNGLMGVLEFLYENPELYIPSFEMKGRYIANYFNRLGATRQLSALPRSFFKDECYKMIDVIRGINTEEDLRKAQGLS